MGQLGTTVKGINHVGLSVRDLSRTVEFYRSATTLELAGRRPLSGRPAPSATGDPANGGPANGGPVSDPVDVAVMQGPNAYLELTQFAPAATAGPRVLPVEGPGFTHICYQSPAPLELYTTFIDLQATPVSRAGAPIDLGGYGVLYGYARDADGIMFEVEQLDAPPFDGPIWIAHVALVSPDIDRLVDFYERLLGVAPYRRVNKVTGPRADEVTGLDDVRIRAAWFNVGNMVLELWQYVNPVTARPGEPAPFEAIGYNKFVFEVADLASEYERLTAAGVEFIGTPTGTNGGREVFARDPDGNLFGLQQLGPDDAHSIDRLRFIDWM